LSSARNTPEFWHFGRPAVNDIETTAAEVEALGFDGMVLTDSQNLSPDTYIALTLAARATKQLLLGPGVTNPLTRHPAVTAGAIASLQSVSDGRAVLGIGRGDSSLFNIGARPVGVAAFEQYVSTIQQYLRGESVQYADYASPLRWLDSAASKVPLDVAGTGPNVLTLAARFAERVSFSVGADVERLSWACAHVRDAAKAAGTPCPSMGAYVNICVHQEPSRAVELVRAGVGIFAHFTGMKGAPRNRVDDNDQAVFDRLGNYDRARHGRADAGHAQAMPAEFIKRFAIVGDVEHCIVRLRELFAVGLDRVVLIGPRADQFGAEAADAMQTLASEVLPRVRAY
jgi:5,10-methylenetetrahydromethanopterin reductase